MTTALGGTAITGESDKFNLQRVGRFDIAHQIRQETKGSFHHAYYNRVFQQAIFGADLLAQRFDPLLDFRFGKDWCDERHV